MIWNKRERGTARHIELQRERLLCDTKAWRRTLRDALKANLPPDSVPPPAELTPSAVQFIIDEEVAAREAEVNEIVDRINRRGQESVWPGGRKDDAGKDPWRLFPWDTARAIVKVLTFGAGKYGERNWEKGMDWSRPFDACIRHLTAWWEGEKADPETGFSHLWHAGCCILFLIAYEIRSVGRDNRPSAPPSS